MLIAPRRLLWLFLAFLLPGSARAQTSFDAIVVFGDSLSDTGNIAHLVQNATGGLITYPGDNQALGLNYTAGRFTDGTDTQPPAQAYFGVWIEQLAASLPAKPAVKDALDGGTNYAYGDATTGPGTTSETDDGITITLHNMGQQVADYQANVASASAAGPTAQTLYVLWGGANDLYQAASAGTDLTAATTAAVTNELSLVQQLASAGATNFMIPNLPPLGGVPNYATSANAAALNAASAGFAQALTQGIANLKASLAAQGITITVYQPDIFDLFAKFAAGPMAVGLSDVTDKAQGITGNPDTYLIWDGLHPTTTGHHFAAATAANLLTPLVTSTTVLSVPAAVIAGQPVTVTANVTSSTTGNVPAGLVTFFSGTALLGSSPLNASGVGTATFSPVATASPYSITAVYVGDEVNNLSTSTAQVLTALPAPVATTTTLTSSSGLSVAIGSSVAFTATVTPSATTYGPATGTVTFLNGTATLGTGTLTNGVATYTTTTLPAGTLSITASYAASGVFGASVSATSGLTVAAPGFTASLNPTSITIASGASGTTSLGASRTGNFNVVLTPSCGTLPAHMSCSFSVLALPVPVGQEAWSLTIATNAATAALDLPSRPGQWRAPSVVSATLLFAGTLLLGFRRRLSSLSRLTLLILITVASAGAMVGLSGCGSSSSNNTPAGTYTVPVIVTPDASSMEAAQTVNLSVTVQ